MMDSLEIARRILHSNLQLGARAGQLDANTPLMGHLPELNSLTAMGIISAIEEQTGCTISDLEITADIFETVGSLAAFIHKKIS